MSGLNWISYTSNSQLNAETVTNTSQLYSNAISFFKTPPALNSSGRVTTLQMLGTDITQFSSTNPSAVVFSGYFVPDRTGNWSFDTSLWSIDPTIDPSINSIPSNDFGILFVGTEDSSLSIIVPDASYTNVSSSVSNSTPIIYNNYKNVLTSNNSVYLNRGKNYPILYYWNQNNSGYSIALKFKYATDTNYITNFNKYIYTNYASSPIYYTGTTPSITKIATGNANALRIFYNSALGCPAPTYYYSVDVSSNRQLIGSYNSPIDISGLSNGPHTIYIIAENTDPSYNYWIAYDSSSGTPYTTENVPSMQFQYLKIAFLAVFSQSGSDVNIQFADWNFYDISGNRIDYSKATATWVPVSKVFNQTQHPLPIVDVSFGVGATVDGTVSYTSSGVRFNTTITKNYLLINFGILTTAYKYNYTSGDSWHARDPVSWNLYSSIDGINYSLLDKVQFYYPNYMDFSPSTDFIISNYTYDYSTKPIIRSITNGFNQVTVDYTPLQGSNPKATYYYSVNGVSNLTTIGSYTSPITIPLISGVTNTVYITAKGFDSSSNVIWTTFDSSLATPYTTPSITNKSIGLNSVRVYFNPASTISSPIYYYSIDGSSNPVVIGSYVSSIDISGLSQGTHSIYIIAKGFDSSSNVIWTTFDFTFATPYSINPIATFQYLKFEFTGIRGRPDNIYITPDIQITDINVYNDTTRVDYSNATISYSFPLYYDVTFGDGPPQNAIDNNINTKFGGVVSGFGSYSTINGQYTLNKPASLTINFKKQITATKYNFITGNDSNDRDPVAWIVYSSNNGIDYSIVDYESNVPITLTRSVPTQYFNITNYTVGSYSSIIPLPISFSQIQFSFSPSVGIPNPTYYYYSIDGSSTLVSIGTSAVPFVVDNLSTGTHSISITARGFDSSSNLIWSTISTSTGSTYNVGTQPTINAVTQLPNNRMGVSFNNSFKGVPTPTYSYSLDGSSTLVNITNNSNFFVIDNVSGINHTISITAKGLDSSSNVIWSTTSATCAESAYIPTRLYNDGTMWTAFTTDPSYNLASSSDGITWNSSFSSTATNAMLNLPTLFTDSSLNIYPGFNYPINSVPSSIVPIATKYVHNNSDRGCAKIQPLTIACGQGNTTMAYSVDGIQWVSINNSLFTSSNKAVWNGLKWVAVGTGAYWVATSYDGLSWTGQNSTLMTECYDIAWNGTYFVAVGYNSSVASLATSVDGITWTSVTISSIFSTYIHAIEWTGSVWLAYGAGTNTTAVSSSINASIWTATSTQNLCVVDCSNLVFGNISATTASSTNGGFSPANAFDGSFNTVITKWQSASSNYNTSGAYTGTTTTPYNPSSSTSGEWLQVQLTNPVVCKHYYIVFSIDDASAIPKSWHLLGSNDGTSWDPLDNFNYGTTTPPNNNWKYPFVCLPLSIQSNTTAYSYYRIIFQTSFGNSYVSVSEFVLFDGGSKQLDRYIRPIVLKDIILHPTRILSVDGVVPNVYRITDLSCNLIQTGIVHGGKYVNNTLYGLAAEPAATAFDGLNHLVFSTSGKIAYLSNTASNTNLNFDNSFNGVVIAGSTTAINAACYNRKFILYGDASGSISYGILNASSPPTFYSTNASSLFSTIYGLASNSGYGFVVSPNTIYLKEDESLSIVTPKFYDSALSSDTSISFNVYKASN